MNLLLMTDSYKAGHSRAYPSDMTHLYSYVESRGGRFPATVFFGLQYYLDKYLTWGITEEDVDEAEAFWSQHFGRDYFEVDKWRKMIRKHGGNLPIRIKAVPEGSLIPTGNVLMTIENTDEEFPFVVTFFETLLLKLWYPTTVATQSYYIRQAVREQFERSGSDLAALDFAVHDFGYRGVSSEETAMLGGAAHLLNFKGTDTVAGIRLLQDFYNGGMSGFSIPATEHSVICAFGRGNEDEAFQHFLDEFPSGVIACVSDTYDIYNAVENLWGEQFRGQIMARDGRLVIRPDSGNPLVVVPQLLHMLGEQFGYTRNAKDYKLLDPHVRIIQGDGMDIDSIDALYRSIVDLGWAAENLVVGSGGGLLQTVNRDTCKFALKVSEARFKLGDGYLAAPISKSPVTDPSKRSKEGRFKLVRTVHGWKTVSTVGLERIVYEASEDALQTVFEDGKITRHETLDHIRARLRSQEAGIVEAMAA